MKLTSLDVVLVAGAFDVSIGLGKTTVTRNMVGHYWYLNISRCLYCHTLFCLFKQVIGVLIIIHVKVKRDTYHKA